MVFFVCIELLYVVVWFGSLVICYLYWLVDVLYLGWGGCWDVVCVVFVVYFDWVVMVLCDVW